MKESAILLTHFFVYCNHDSMSQDACLLSFCPEKNPGHPLTQQLFQPAVKGSRGVYYDFKYPIKVL